MLDMLARAETSKHQRAAGRTLLGLAGEGGAFSKGLLVEQAGRWVRLAEPGHSWKAVSQGRRAPPESALLKGCPVGVAPELGNWGVTGGPKKVPGPGNSAPLPHELPEKLSLGIEAMN